MRRTPSSLRPDLSRHVVLFQTSPLMPRAEAEVPTGQAARSQWSRSVWAGPTEGLLAAKRPPDPHVANPVPVRPLVLRRGQGLTGKRSHHCQPLPASPGVSRAFRHLRPLPSMLAGDNRQRLRKTPPTRPTSSEGPQATTSSECSAAPSPGTRRVAGESVEKGETPDLHHRSVSTSSWACGHLGTRCGWAGLLFIDQI